MRAAPLALMALATVAACNLPVATQPPAVPRAAASPTVLAPPPTEPPTPLPEATAAPTAEPTAPEPQPLRMAYVLDGNVWALELGSAPVQLTFSGTTVDVRLTDDGQRIAYLEQQPAEQLVELRSVAFDGTDDRVLIDQPSFDALYPLETFQHYAPAQMAMVPGTHHLLFNTRGVLEGPGLAKNDDLLQVNVDHGELTALLSRGQGGDFRLSPDASQLATVRPDGIGFASRDGSQLRPEVLSFTPVITYSEYLYYPRPVWAGQAVVAAIPGEDPFFGPQMGSLWRVPADGSNPVQLAALSGDLFAPQQGHAIISPDGSYVAFYRRPEDSGPVQLWIYGVEDGSETKYTEGALTWLGWAPDSNHFIYQDESQRELMIGQLGETAVSLGDARLLHWVGGTQYLMLLEVTDGSQKLVLGSPGGAATELAGFRGDLTGSDFAD